MSDLIYWFGVCHLTAYAIVGTLLLAEQFVNYVVKTTGTYKVLITAVAKVYRERAARQEPTS